jgi:hypothetical protein
VKAIHQDAVVHNLATTHVDAVMGKAETRRNEVRAQRRLFVPRQKPIAPAKSGEGAALADRQGSVARLTMLVRMGTIES